MTQEDRVTLAIASGKGGVGKTTLAMSIGYELSLARKTLLVDLDFFNRGMTGTLGAGETQGTIPALSFDGETVGSEPEWRIRDVGPNLCFLEIPDLETSQLGRFQGEKVETILGALTTLIDNAAAHCGAQSIVLDCHGGPDNTSFAACLLADQSILVSEPDLVTLYGTLHFLRRARSFSDEDTLKPSFHLLLNKVGPSFNGRFLANLYNRDLRQEFDENPLLSVVPIETFLDRVGDKTPFLTSLFPYSQLAGKIRQSLIDLLADHHPDALCLETRWGPAFLRKLTRYNLGYFHMLADASFVFNLTAFLGLALGTVFFLQEAAENLRLYEVYNFLRSFFDDSLTIAISKEIFIFLFLWCAGTFFLKFSRYLDRKSMICVIERSFSRLLGYGFAFALISFLPMITLISFPMEMVEKTVSFSSFPSLDLANNYYYSRVFEHLNSVGQSILALVFPGMVLTTHAYRTVRVLIFRSFALETLYRVLVFSSMIASITLGSLVL